MQSLSGAGFAAVSAVDATVLLIMFSGVFAVGATRRRHRYVDALWGAAFAVVAVTTAALTSGYGDPWRRWLLTVCTVVWGLRLSAHIARRGWGAGEDPRYTAMLAKASGHHPARAAFTRVYLLQAVLVWFISLPVQVGMAGTGRSTAGTAAAAAGVALWLAGLFFEAVGDWQLARFQTDPAHRGHLMTTGLWRYTRHPNYFGDACVWWGLFLIAAGTGTGLLTVVGPILMTWLLTAGSGKPLMEAHLSATRPGYADYAARTSAFIPRPPRRPGNRG